MISVIHHVFLKNPETAILPGVVQGLHLTSKVSPSSTLDYNFLAGISWLLCSYVSQFLAWLSLVHKIIC